MVFSLAAWDFPFRVWWLFLGAFWEAAGFILSFGVIDSFHRIVWGSVNIRCRNGVPMRPLFAPALTLNTVILTLVHHFRRNQQSHSKKCLKSIHDLIRGSAQKRQQHNLGLFCLRPTTPPKKIRPHHPDLSILFGFSGPPKKKKNKTIRHSDHLDLAFFLAFPGPRETTKKRERRLEPSWAPFSKV